MDGASWIGTAQALDQDCTLFLNGLGTWWSDWFWMMMSDKTVWIPAYAACVFFLFRRLGCKKALIVLLSVAITFGLCDQLSNLAKYSVARLRPCYNSAMLRDGLAVLERRGSFYGFFSAHAANAFSLAVCLSMGLSNDKAHDYGSFRRWAFLWALLVSVSRVFVGKHYLGDVLAGALAGIVTGYILGAAARAFIRRFLDRERPLTVPAAPSPSGSPGSPSQG